MLDRFDEEKNYMKLIKRIDEIGNISFDYIDKELENINCLGLFMNSLDEIGK